MREFVSRGARLAAVLAIITQGAILDYYLIHYNGAAWAPWIIADVVAVVVFLWCFLYAQRYFETYDRLEQDENRRRTTQEWKKGPKIPRAPAILPLVYLGWLVYSSMLVARIVVIFKSFGSTLSGEKFLGTNLLEFVIAGTAGIFAFILAARSRKPTASQKVCLKFLQYHVLLEIIDSVEFLTILFTAEHTLMIPGFVYDMILAFGCINMILPTLGLYQLSATNFNRPKPRENFYIIQTILSTVFGNMPFLIIRVFLWTDHQFTNALFVMKNIIAIVQNIFELMHYFYPEKDHGKKESERGHDGGGDGGKIAVLGVRSTTRIPEKDDLEGATQRF
ncbi:hypothetical protein BV898_07317 [Hypsibius exemplaris]|uniref:Uncharacterized protein n=1 Tax=Hypsibius exemplaris TaxID=2072580 RepID=A0A1W0WU04_HYPEX|nr:hypothetical protein BV898_07317 [Hypsibius exemplaris]